MSHNVCQCQRGLRSIWLRYKSATKHRNASAIIRVQLQLLWPTIYAFLWNWAEMSEFCCLRQSFRIEKFSSLYVSIVGHSFDSFLQFLFIDCEVCCHIVFWFCQFLEPHFAERNVNENINIHSYNVAAVTHSQPKHTHSHKHTYTHTRAVKFNDVWQPSFIFPYLFDEQTKWANGFCSIFIDTFPHFHRNKSLEMDSRLACIHQTLVKRTSNSHLIFSFERHCEFGTTTTTTRKRKNDQQRTAHLVSLGSLQSYKWSLLFNERKTVTACVRPLYVRMRRPSAQYCHFASVCVCVCVCGCECATEFDTVVCVGLCVV